MCGNVANFTSEQKQLSTLLRLVAPESVDVLQRRWSLLKEIEGLQPVGRRMLSTKLHTTERIIRTEAEKMRAQGLISFSSEGMILTEKGYKAMEMLFSFFHEFNELEVLEQALSKHLKIKKVLIGSSGTSDEQSTLKELGKCAAAFLKTCIKETSVVGVTGGASLYHTVQAFEKERVSLKSAVVVPARGGVGKQTQFQANTLAEVLAAKLGAKHQVLYTPDNLSDTAISSLKKEPSIRCIMKNLEGMDILAFGIGEAEKMAKRRRLDAHEIGKIVNKGAVAEAFGYYFDSAGNIVHEISTIGISLSKFKQMQTLVAVAGGKQKAKAIGSICKLNSNLVLVTDEQAAKEILEKHKGGAFKW